MRTATTLEQSRKLLSLGIDPETADMFYTNYANKHNDGIAYIGKVGIREDLIPAWSLSSLIALFPRTISTKSGHGGTIVSPIHFYFDDGWFIGYIVDLQGCAPDLFAACTDLIGQLVEQGYIKTKKV